MDIKFYTKTRLYAKNDHTFYNVTGCRGKLRRKILVSKAANEFVWFQCNSRWKAWSCEWTTCSKEWKFSVNKNSSKPLMMLFNHLPEHLRKKHSNQISKVMKKSNFHPRLFNVNLSSQRSNLSLSYTSIQKLKKVFVIVIERSFSAACTRFHLRLHVF